MSTPFSDDNEVDIDAVWAQIVARWDDEAPPRGEATRRATDPEPYDYERDQVPLDPVGTGPRDVNPDSPSFLDAIGATDEESYEPPPPPPLPRPSLVTGTAWCAAIGGPLFLVFCAMFWRGAPSLVVAGAVAAFAGGFVTLVLRMSDNDTDDGAVV